MAKLTPYLLLAFLGGVMLRSFFDIPENWILGALGLAGGVLTILFFSARLIPHPLKFFSASFFLIFFLLGALRFSVFENKIATDRLHNYYGQTVTLQGRVLSSKLKPNSSRIVLETDWGRLLIVKRIYPEYKYGDTLEVKGEITAPEPYAGINVPKLLAKDRIYSQTLFPEITKIDYAPNKFLNSLFFIKDKFTKQLKIALPEPYSSLANGMLLGEEGVLPKNILDSFRKSSTIHILVLSGYNITIVGSFIMSFFGFFLPAAFAWIISLAGIVLFTLMTGAEPAAVRAALMAIIGLVALRTGRQYLAISALLWAAFFMILWNPMYLRFDRGFQLSLLATLGLILLSNRLFKKFWFFPKWMGVREAASSTVAAQLFVLPLLISWGNEISYLTVPANMVIVSLVPTIMLFSFLSGISGFIFQPISAIFAVVPYLLIKFQIYAATFFARF